MYTKQPFFYYLQNE